MTESNTPKVEFRSFRMEDGSTATIAAIRRTPSGAATAQMRVNYSLCNPADTFNRKLGQQTALRRLAADLNSWIVTSFRVQHAETSGRDAFHRRAEISLRDGSIVSYEDELSTSWANFFSECIKTARRANRERLHNSARNAKRLRAEVEAERILQAAADRERRRAAIDDCIAEF